MKTKTIVAIFLLLAGMLCLLTACDQPSPDEDTDHVHAYESIVIPPTKTNDGYTKHTCSVCGDTYTDSPVPATVFSVGLAYKVNGDGTTCTVTGQGTCRDSEIDIPPAIDGYPVTAIANGAFRDHTRLRSTTIPDSVTSIGDEAFRGCANLTSIKIPDSVTSIGHDAFNGCERLTSIKIPNGVKIINAFTFSGCSRLESVTIPDSVVFFGEHAFAGCASLTSIEIPDSVTGMGIYTFIFCTKLTSVTLSDNMTSIGDYALWKCSSLTSVMIPKSVTRIEVAAFSECTELNTVYYSGTASDWSSISIATANDELTSATVYYYSETEPTTEGNYWRYVDGVPTPWA